jgi:hypothetical protein
MPIQEISLRVLLVVLATWRITHLLALEDGPGDVVIHLRTKLGHGFWGKLMDCFYCLSLWISAPMALFLPHHFREWPLYWLAVSGAACLLERATSLTSQSGENLP